jgi:hypothetical protein
MFAAVRAEFSSSKSWKNPGGFVTSASHRLALVSRSRAQSRTVLIVAVCLLTGLTAPARAEAAARSSRPTIVSLSPPAASTGTVVTIAGSGFGATQGASIVTFNGTRATPSTWSAASITVPVPAGATTGNVVVTVGRWVSNGLPFTVTAPAPPAPTLTALSPVGGPVGTTITITGTNFGATQGANMVTFNGTSAAPSTWSATNITVPVPAGATSGNVVVTVGGQVSNGLPFTVAAPTPQTKTVTAAWNPNPELNIAGYKLSYGSSSGSYTSTMDVGNVTNAVVQIVTGQTYYFVVQAYNTAGQLSPYSAEVPFTLATSSPTPTLIGLSPTGGRVGTSIAITGTTPGATQNVSAVTQESATGSQASPLVGHQTSQNDGLRATDYDGDSRSDPATFFPATGTWAILLSGANYSTSLTAALGTSTDVPVPGDYDGDGKTDIAVYRPADGTWRMLTSSSGYMSSVAFTWGGAAGDVPVPGDYDGDGMTDIAVYRPSTGEWLLTLSATKTTMTLVLGAIGDVPVIGDFDGDGRTDVAVFTPSTGALSALTSSTNYTAGRTLPVHAGTGIPVAGDYDGDGTTDMATFSPSTGTWTLVPSTASSSSITRVTLGGGDDIPVPGDYDGDGRTDIAVYRPSTGLWTIISSRDGSMITFTWGNGPAVPLPRRP